MEPLIYTSSFVCDQIAERHIRQFNVNRNRESEFLKNIIEPFGKALGRGGKKTRSGTLKDVMRSMCKRLDAEDCVLAVVVESLTPSFSTNEAYSIKFVMALSDDTECVEFSAAHILLTRKDLTISSSELDFKIHRHALSRFMQREHKPLKTFFESAIEPMLLSSVISTACSGTSETNNVALPMGDGLLLGKFETFDPEQHPNITCRVKFSQSGADMTYHYCRSNLVEKQRIKTTMLTYIDKDGMTTSRDSIHEMLGNFADAEGENLNTLFGATFFFEEKSMENVKHLVSSAMQITKSDAWKFFEKTARKD